jgi:hypothetical protein
MNVIKTLLATFGQTAKINRRKQVSIRSFQFDNQNSQRALWQNLITSRATNDGGRLKLT